MARAVLVAFPLKAGEALLNALSNIVDAREKVDVKAAFWLYMPEVDDWRLYISSPDVEKIGPLEAYKRVQSALTQINENLDDCWNELKLNNIAVISPNNKLIKALREIAGAGATNTRVRGGSVDGISLDEAYVYRLQ